MGSDKVRENLLRRQAKRRGLRLVKSRRRDPGASDFGRYMLVHGHTGAPIDGVGQPFAMSLDAAEAWLGAADPDVSEPSDCLFKCQWCGTEDDVWLDGIGHDGTCRLRCDKCGVVHATGIRVTQLRAAVPARLEVHFRRY